MSPLIRITQAVFTQYRQAILGQENADERQLGKYDHFKENNMTTVFCQAASSHHSHHTIMPA